MTHNDDVNHPQHYNLNEHGVECIDAIQACTSKEGFEEYLRGNVMKYLWRCNYKDHKIKDLKKAQWYLEKLLSVADVELSESEPEPDLFSIHVGGNGKEVLFVENIKETVNAAE